MARRKRVYRKIERRDPRYDSALVGKLISKVMLDGKRSLAERIVYAAIDMANEGTDSIDPLEVITRAIENAKPRVEVKSRRVGAPPTRCLWKWTRPVPNPWPCAGL